MAQSRSSAEKFRTAADMADTGVALKRQQLRRRHPNASEAETERSLRSWLHRRAADGPGSSRKS